MYYHVMHAQLTHMYNTHSNTITANIKSLLECLKFSNSILFPWNTVYLIYLTEKGKLLHYF